MPEGPEIRIAADRIAEVLVGREVEDAFFEQPHLRPLGESLPGQEVADITTRGKAMLTRFSGGLTLYSHNQLYGRWYVRPRGQMPNTRRTLRVALHTAEHSALLYSASDIALLDADGLLTHPFLARVGPDILDEALTPAIVAKRLASKAFAGRSLAALYLDQGFLAGVGNYLRSEILFFAGVRHDRRPKDLDAAERRRLARVTLDISRRSYATRGITNPDRIVKRRKKAGLTRREGYRFAVFGRDGEACDSCDAVIERVEAGSRRLYFCPACQS